MSGDEELDKLLSKVPQSGGTSREHADDGVLLAYREQRLSDAEREVLEKHLTSCAECRALFAELSSPLPADLEEWGKKTLAKKQPRQWALAGIAAAVAAGVLFYLVIIPRGESLPPEYTIRGPLGGVQSLRGEANESRVFVPASRIELIAEPKDGTGGAASMIVFVEELDGALHAAPEVGLTRGEGGTFRYELEAERLFGAGYGKRKLHIAFEGPSGESRRIEIELDYRASEKGD